MPRSLRLGDLSPLTRQSRLPSRGADDQEARVGDAGPLKVAETKGRTVNLRVTGEGGKGKGKGGEGKTGLEHEQAVERARAT